MRLRLAVISAAFLYIALVFVVLWLKDPGHIYVDSADLRYAVGCATQWPKTDDISHCEKQFVHHEGHLYRWAPGIAFALLAGSAACATGALYFGSRSDGAER